MSHPGFPLVDERRMSSRLAMVTVDAGQPPRDDRPVITACVDVDMMAAS